jgi:hypothetical protein
MDLLTVLPKPNSFKFTLCISQERNPGIGVMSLDDGQGSVPLVNQPVILVIEDDQAVQTVVEEALTEGGFEPAIAARAKKPLPC